MRVLLDANLSPGRIGDPLRERGHNVRALAAEPDLEGLDDEPVLEFATQDERILVTRNSRDFAPLTRLCSEVGREHAGVILIWSLTHRQFNEIVRGVEHWLGQTRTRRTGAASSSGSSAKAATRPAITITDSEEGPSR